MSRLVFGISLGLFAGLAAAEDLDASLSSLDGLLFDEIPVVVTPAKVAQPRVEVSSTLSVLDGEFIRRSNVQYVEDLLFFVPGFFVGPYSNSYDKIAVFHGTELDRYRRIQVLVNGRSVYSSAYARVDWSALSVNVEDIDRIEVNRGPNASSYGANSFLAVINIITRSPVETLGTSVNISHGTGQYSTDGFDTRVYAQHSGINDNWSYRVSGSKGTVAGYEQDFDGNERDDGHQRSTGNVYIVYEDVKQTIDFDFGVTQLDATVGTINTTGVSYGDQDPELDYQRQHFKTAWEGATSSNHTLKAQYYYEKSDQKENHEIGVSGALLNYLFNQSVNAGSTYYGDLVVDLKETRHDVELQSTWTPNSDYRFVNTVSYRQDEVYSKTYFNGSYTEELLRASSNVSYRALDPVIVNTGVMWEDSKLTGEYVSPQVGATFKLTEQAALRANVSKAYRTPDLYDQQAQWSYVFNGIRSTPANASGEDAEKITSYEVGYFQHIPHLGLTYDLSFYREELTDLVPSTKKYEDAVSEGGISRGYTFDAVIEGVELEADWRGSTGAIVRATAAYQKTNTDEDKLLVTVAPLVATLFVSAPINERIWFNNSYIYGRDMAEYDFKLLNTWLTYKVSNSDSDFTAGVGTSRRLDENPYIRKNNISDGRTTYYVFANLSF